MCLCFQLLLYQLTDLHEILYGYYAIGDLTIRTVDNLPQHYTAS